jgi:hypothetical protein
MGHRPGRACYEHGDLGQCDESRPVSPELLRGLAGDPEPGADVGPGVAVVPEAGHSVADAGVDGAGQFGHEGQGLDVAGGDPARVCRQDAPDERGVLRVLDGGARPVCRQALVDSGRALGCPPVFGARRGAGRGCGAHAATSLPGELGPLLRDSQCGGLALEIPRVSSQMTRAPVSPSSAATAWRARARPRSPWASSTVTRAYLLHCASMHGNRCAVIASSCSAVASHLVGFTR